jgi:hypothetical protein
VENDVNEMDKKLAFDMTLKVAEAQLSAQRNSTAFVAEQAKPEYWFDLYHLCLAEMTNLRRMRAQKNKPESGSTDKENAQQKPSVFD